ncbi:MAG TPA: zf-HC2 domain-containing protein [Candidatus Kapabacteria bacterium]|nr:zf-HC2 domain-containing protein [Candidatus Kapabacteria bacterium]
MDCKEVQLYLTDLVDKRDISKATQEAIERHLANCANCQSELELAHVTKSFVTSRFSPVTIPSPTVSAVRSMIVAETNRSEAFDRANSVEGFWSIFRKRPILAYGSLVVAVLLIWLLSPGQNKERLFNESQAAFIAGDINAFDHLISGSEPIQIETSDEIRLKMFFAAHGISCDVEIPHFAKASIVGGMVNFAGKVPIAHVVYKFGNHMMCMCELRMADMCASNRLGISDSAQHCLANGTVYWYCDGAKKHSVGLWKYKNTFCSVTSDCDPQELASIFQSREKDTE